MYTHAPLPGNLEGIESLNFHSYWTAIKDKIAELRELPTWATQHAMKLGVTVSNLKKAGNYAAVNALDLEIKKVNDDIAKAWKVRQYIDQYLPEWMNATKQSAGSGAPIVPVNQATGSKTAAPQQPVTVYQEPTLFEDVTGWAKSLLNDSPRDGQLGVLPIVAISASGIAALAYVVTVGMSLWQDYKFKKDLSQQVIEGKITSGQFAQIVTSARPPENVVDKLVTQVGGNLATVALVAGVGYLAFTFLLPQLLSKKAA